MKVVYQVWEDQGWEMPVVEESYNPDRTRLSLYFAEKMSEQNKRTKQANKTSEQREWAEQEKKKGRKLFFDKSVSGTKRPIKNK